MENISKELIDRGFCNASTANLDIFGKRIVTAYIGFDLTADSLHVGSLIQLMVLRKLYNSGHSPIALLGEATTRIGDPTAKAHNVLF